LEQDAVLSWVRVVLDSLSVNVPGLVESVMAVVEDSVSVVSVGFTMDIEALASIVADVSSWSTIEGNLLVSILTAWSHDSSTVNTVALSSLVSKTEVSFSC
jgi:hypothetical protein